MSNKFIVHCGFNNDPEVALIKNYAYSYGLEYRWQGIKNDLFKAADIIKHASMAVIWNGMQHYGPLITNLCSKRNIPRCYIEWGMLPQSETFFIDPFGFCSESILTKNLSWITSEDINNMLNERDRLQSKYKINCEDYVLVPLQIENDTQILHYSPYNNMEEFIKHIKIMYPNNKILVKTHPKSGAKRQIDGVEIIQNGDFLELASKASVVVGITSTCLYESAILGIPVISLGDHPLRINKISDHEKVISGAYALNINRYSGDLRKILERFNIKPL
jgi:hypothetical protein